MKDAKYNYARFVSSKLGSAFILVAWLVVIVFLSGIAPGAKQFAINSTEGSINTTPTAEAQTILNEQFPSDDGLVALLVFHGEYAINAEQRANIVGISEWLSSADKPTFVSSAMPFHHFPAVVQDKLFSEGKTTTMLNVALHKGLETDEIHETLEQIRDYVTALNMEGIQLEITGPAGIAADTIAIFKNADLVLLFSTIGLIMFILIIIYRSPLLAILPLVIAGMVYQVVDRILGLAAKYGWIVVDSQALSIMMILLFAVITDYCLFVLSRYREELRKIGSKHDAMKIGMTHVSEPILFSGATVFVAVIVLFLADFKVYHYFAPVFSVAVIVILLGGLTLIPAMFTLVGRKAFWPFVPKLGEQVANLVGLWSKVGGFVTRKPAFIASVLFVLMIGASLNVGGINYSFNLMKSFPQELSSRQGFDILEERFPQGQLAPTSIVLVSEKEIEVTDDFIEKLVTLTESIQAVGGISELSPDFTADNAISGRSIFSEEKRAVQLQLTLQHNPYEQTSLDIIEGLRDRSESMLQDSGFDTGQYALHYAGQTAGQVDVRSLNERDTMIVFSLITLFIFIMLIFQSRSLVIGSMMMGTMVLSYLATLGFSWLVFKSILGLEAMSYRMPMYTFVFLMALGIDYNIMLISRILEKYRKMPWIDAISQGVAKTGGVISSAGIVLAATFCVLITQPLQELYLFGFMMAVGILIDTFFVRGMLLPALLTFIRRGRQERVGRIEVN